LNSIEKIGITNIRRVMKDRKKRRILIALVIVPFITAGLLIFIFICQDSIVNYLSSTHKIKADILLYEGWLPETAVEVAINEFKTNDYNLIITTGLKSDDLDFCMVPMNGYLIFYPASDLFKDEQIRIHLIEILAHSKMGGKYSSHFNFYVNDSLTAEFIADEKERKYSIKWTGALKDIDSVMVHFDDDYLDEGGDKNLYVKEIIIDNNIIIPYKFNSVYDVGRLGGTNRIINDYDTHGELSRNIIIRNGINSSSVVAVTGGRANINRTIKSALAFRNWLKTYDDKSDEINIISMGIHSRRTLVTYKSILGKKVKIGIISLPESEKPGIRKLKYLDILTEVLNLVYYRIILLPYSIFR
jgi:hypothetical protein